MKPAPILFPLLLLITSGLVSCGDQLKVAACQKMIEISNRVIPPEDPNNPQTFTPQEAIKQAEQAFQRAKQLEAIALQDPTLTEYKDRIAQSYQQKGEVLKQMAQEALAAQGLPTTDPKLVEQSRQLANLYLQATQVYEQQRSTVQELTQYCQLDTPRDESTGILK